MYSGDGMPEREGIPEDIREKNEKPAGRRVFDECGADGTRTRDLLRDRQAF
jgi:hypothetical protein